MNKSLSPRQAAEVLGISPDTLRRWEREGLIQSERTPGGQRRYRENAISEVLNGAARRPVRSHFLSADSHEDRSGAPLPEREGAQHLLPEWERRIKEERAELEVTKLRRERAAVLRGEREERVQRERELAEKDRIAVMRRAEEARSAEAAAAEEKRLASLRRYGEALACFAPSEYQAKVTRYLLSNVTTSIYPPEIPDHLAKAELHSRIQGLLKPWHDAEERERAAAHDRALTYYLIGEGTRYARGQVREWESADATRALRDVEKALEGEVEPEWTHDDVHDLVDDVLGEWEE